MSPGNVQALAKALGVTVLDFVVEDGEAETRPAQMGRPRKAPCRGAGDARERPADFGTVGEREVRHGPRGQAEG
ncbi:MAG TPA: hypothetical protein VKD72_12565 [Gemmataceae bacterium]|nr:hypothetical protein [Gemmataceae bacterium]